MSAARKPSKSLSAARTSGARARSSRSSTKSERWNKDHAKELERMRLERAAERAEKREQAVTLPTDKRERLRYLQARAINAGQFGAAVQCEKMLLQLDCIDAERTRQLGIVQANAERAVDREHRKEASIERQEQRDAVRLGAVLDGNESPIDDEE